MTKTALQAAKTKAAFQWDPNVDQIYNLDQDLTLPGPPESFNKMSGKSFTMDAAFQTLTLQPTPSKNSATTWGEGGDAPAVIDVKRGTFIYDASNGGQTVLFLGGVGTSETTLRVGNNAQFSIVGDPNGLLIDSGEGLLNINVEDEGVRHPLPSVRYRGRIHQHHRNGNGTNVSGRLRYFGGGGCYR